MPFITNLFLGFFFIMLFNQLDMLFNMIVHLRRNYNYRAGLELENNDTEKPEKEDENEANKKKKVIKYEDKYLDKFIKMESFEISQEELDTFSNKIVMENTPLGNVLMHWDNNRETFIYYSDMNIPYRFLEVVARKYVTMNNCKSIFIDMNDELQTAKQIIEDKKKVLEDKKTEEYLGLDTIENKSSKSKDPEEKKSVFAKLKSYNTDNNKSNAILLDSKKSAHKPMNTNAGKQEKEKEKDYILKERANRYSYEGKMMNFQFLKKVDKKLVDKNYALSFADFKKLQFAN